MAPEPLHHETSVGLRWRDIDVLGHVNQSVYHELLEEARAGLLGRFARRVGGDVLARGGVVVRHVELDFHHEVRRDDERVRVSATVAHVGTSSVQVRQEIRLDDGTLAAGGMVVLVAWDARERGKRELTPAERAVLRGD